MTPSRQDETLADEREDQLDAILADFLGSDDCQSSVRRQQLISTHPEFADELRDYFETRDRFEVLAGPLRQATSGDEPFLDRDTVGEYEIRDVLARGGMGIVYRAWQPSLDRFVALKMLSAGEHSSPEALRRFRTEAEVIAGLEHPNIVPIYEVGSTERNQPYLCMKFVEGGNLAECRSESTPPTEIVRVVRSLVDALDHAHQRGILHRDLKPANILIEGTATDSLDKCRPLLSDFGLALRERTDSIRADVEPTRTGTVLGTPSYMSPEQAKGNRLEVTTASDVYGLGAILYDGLTGRAPFEGDTTYDIIRQVIEDEPNPPRTLRKDIPRDLETICMKCLAKEPTHRYSSVRELGDDLDRFLGGEPIRGSRMGRLARVYLWAKRQPFVASLLAALALTLLVGSTIALVLWRRAETNYVQARENHHRAERRLTESNTTFRLAHEVVNEFCVDVSNDIRDYPGLQRRNRERLRTALNYFEKFLELRADDPELQREMADTRANMANILAILGERQRAKKEYQEAERLIRRLLAAKGRDPKLERDVAGTIMNIATVEDDPQERLDLFLRSLALYERGLAKFPDDTKFLSGKAQVLNNLGTMYDNLGRRQDSRSSYESAVAIQRKLVARNPTKGIPRKALATALANLAGLRSHELGGITDAVTSMEEVLGLRKALADTAPSNPYLQSDLALAHHNLGVFQRIAAQPEQSKKSLDKAHSIRERLVRDNPLVLDFASDFASGFMQKGFTLRQNNELNSALDAYKEAHRILSALVRKNPDSVAYRRRLGITLYEIARIFRTGKNPNAEKSAYEEAAKHQRILAEKNPQDPDLRHRLAKTLHGLALNLYFSGHPDEALDAAREAVPHSEYAHSRGSALPQYKDYLNIHYLLIAEITTKKKLVEEAIEVIQSRRRIWTSHPDQLFHCVWELGRLAEVEDLSKADRTRCEELMLEILAQSIDAGYKNLGRLREDPNLNPIRKSPRFAELISRAEKNASEPAKRDNEPKSD